MAAGQRSIVVGVNDSPDAEAGLRWALDDARARNAAIRLVYAYRWDYMYTRIPPYADVPYLDVQQSRKVAEEVVVRMVDRARELDAGIDVDGKAIDGTATAVLIDQSAHASMLVLGSRRLEALGSVMLGSVSAAVAARAACPAVVVRGPAGPVDEGASVVVGVDATEASEIVLKFGFDHASRHHAPLRAVLCWHPDLMAMIRGRSEPPSPARVEAWLSEALAGWRERYPDVDVHSEVIREHPRTVCCSHHKHSICSSSAAMGGMRWPVRSSAPSAKACSTTQPARSWSFPYTASDRARGSMISRQVNRAVLCGAARSRGSLRRSDPRAVRARRGVPSRGRPSRRDTDPSRTPALHDRPIPARTDRNLCHACSRQAPAVN